MIRLSFLKFESQELGLEVYRKVAVPGNYNEGFSYYDLPMENNQIVKYEISKNPLTGYSKYTLPAYLDQGLVSKLLYDNILIASKNLNPLILRDQDNYNRKIHFEIESHPKGKKCIWIEPYFLKSEQIWGVLIGYQFIVDESLTNSIDFKLDKDILIASGTLNSKGLSNLDFYLFKHNHINQFIKKSLSEINKGLSIKISTELFELSSYNLNSKVYIFKEDKISNSPYFGVSQNSPLETVSANTKFYFIYKHRDRDYAVTLLKGLRGDSHPNTFSGIERFFKIPFNNSCIKGCPIEKFDDNSINALITEIKSLNINVIPIIIVDSRKSKEDERLYFWLKHKFTKEGIACQAVTKDLIINENTIKFSLGNIALQIFAKAGGKPWKMKPAGKDSLIIGIGQSYNIETGADGKTIEKNITYSVLTDSSGIFKDLKVLSEGLETNDSYYEQLIKNIGSVIKTSGYKSITIHSPMRLSKDRILDKVVTEIGNDIEVTVLVINSKSDLFGYDYKNNGLVPFESTYVRLAKDEYLVWFEGLNPTNPKITKRYGNPLMIKLWYSNRPNYITDSDFKQNLLQDCINLSGANWRGFKAKQMPVSIFYCQRIAEFIGKFREYHLEHIDINNLKPWFL